MRINPFNLEAVAETIDLTLSMAPEERAARLAKDYDFVRSNSTATWLKVAVQDMQRVRNAMLNASLQSRQPTTGLSHWSGAAARGAPRPGEALPRVSPEAVSRAYRSATRRVLIFGLDGTLIQQEHVIAHLKLFHDFQGHSLQPPAAALHCLATLAADPANVVYVVSGRDAADMQATLSRVPCLGLGAELGYVQLPPRPAAAAGGRRRRRRRGGGPSPYAHRPPHAHHTHRRGGGGGGGRSAETSESNDSGYDCEDDLTYAHASDGDDRLPGAGRGGGAAGGGGGCDGGWADAASEAAPLPDGRMWCTPLADLPPPHPQWREMARALMREFTSRTNGSYEREQRSAMQWCYHDCDPDFGLMQARSLTSALKQRLVGCGVTVSHVQLKGMVMVRLGGVNKGAAADHLLALADRAAPVDFLLCIGDDDDDEFMLSALSARACAPGLRERLQGRLFTVSVGARATSHAQYVAPDAASVLALLETLKGGAADYPGTPQRGATTPKEASPRVARYPAAYGGGGGGGGGHTAHHRFGGSSALTSYPS